MPKLRFAISLSLDGYVAGPDPTLDEPLGVGGEGLHEWAFVLAPWREAHGEAGGVVDESAKVLEEVHADLGATVMGRNMFGGGVGPWDDQAPWTGWWGDEPPYHHPVFVLTHHAREPLVMEGGTTFHFVTEGLEAALARAREAAGGKDVLIAGGAAIARQALRAGLVDVMYLHLVPILLGGGTRLFEGPDTDMHGLALVRTVATPAVVHLHFARGA